MLNNPTIQDFKNQFPRDFPYNADPLLGVTDTDIANAFRQVNININQAFFCDDSGYGIYYNLLAAHYLVMGLQRSAIGVAGGFSFAQSSKSAGSVSVSSAIPQKFLDNPQFGIFAKTAYGAEYLVYILPFLSGNVFAVSGRTQA